ncbi:ARM repeat-containing protein [Marasmius fiardii PR-910]|nr:ARM repeat-containing protein [Marasmius fiardii PR-910]
MTPSSRRIRPLPLIPTMHGKYVASSTVTVTGAGSGSHPSSAECSTPSATDSSSSSSPSFPVSPRTDSLLSSPIPISRPHSSNGRAREISGCPGPDSYEIVHPIPRKGGITHQPMSSQNSDGELEEDLVYGFIFRSMSPLVLHRTSTSQPSTISRPFLDRPSMLAKRRSSSMSNLSQVAGMQNAVSVAVQKPPLPDPDPNLNTYTVYTDAGPVILAGALQAVVQARDEERIGAYLLKIYRCATSGGDTEHVITKFIEAGTVSIIVSLLMARVGEEERYEGEDLLPVLASLGALAQNPVGSTVIFRMNACATLMGLFRSPSENVASLATWCLTRACARNKHVATTLSKQGLPRLLLKHGLGSRYKHQHHTGIVARYAAWCLGNLVQHTENEAFAKPDVITGIIDYLRRTSSPSFVQGSVGSDIPAAEDTCSALFLLSRISRSAKISKQLAKGGCIPYVAHHLNTSHHPDILRWSARAVGCLLRPNSSEIARELLKAGVANGLTRLPRVIAPNDIEPLGPFAFAIQRFCYAEWGGGTRKVLVDAGVVDSLLSALRIAVDSAEASVSSAPTSACVQIELAMAISCLGDFGGKKVRKEILNAGGLLVLKRLASIAGPGTEVEKVCNMAVKSVSGNVVTRNAGMCQFSGNFLKI